MSTPTIPERDEELEKFIQKKFDDESSIIADGEDEGHAVIYHVIFQECMRECATFSTRRAREKAIEEYSQIIRDIVPALGFIDSHRVADPQTLKAYKAVNKFLTLESSDNVRHD